MEEQTKEEIKPQELLSPSSLLSYLKCPREYYYTYILKLPIAKNIHLIKGTIVHSVLEDFFSEYKENFENFVQELFDGKWSSQKTSLESLGLKPEELENHKTDAINMLKTYIYIFNIKINNLLALKAKDRQQAFDLLKPKFRELKIEEPKIHLRGYIDRVYESFSGSVTISDYKTSTRYGTGMPDEYKLQLALYSLMYYYKYNRLPNYASIIFLRYGEEVMMEIYPSLVKQALEKVEEIWLKTRSVDINDYPLKESKLCAFCTFQSKCAGIYDYEKDLRKRQILGLETKNI